MKVYARRTDQIATIHQSGSRSSKENRLILLSGDGRTSGPGSPTPGQSRIEIVSGFASQSYFTFPSPAIPVEYQPVRYVFLKNRRPLVLASPSSSSSAFVTVSLEMPAPDMTVESDERGITWDLGGSDVQWSQVGQLPDDVSFLTLVFKSWQSNTEPAFDVEFSWQLLGEMKILSKVSSFI